MKKTQIDHRSPAPAAPAGLILNPLEVYAGITQHQGAAAHLILLPGEARVVGIEAAEEFAASMGGALPSCAELQPMLKRMQLRFKPGLYYTCDQAKRDGEMATVFCPHGLVDKDACETRVRAVRRVPVSAGTPSAPPKMLDDATHADIIHRVDNLPVSLKRAYVPTPPVFHFDQSNLRDGELYAGVVLDGGIFRHLILLPAEAHYVTWQQAKTFAAAVGGELPDLDDYEVLLQNLRDKFAGDDAYWSSEWVDEKQAFYLDFGADPFRDLDWVEFPMRARAVRRLFAGRERSVLFDWHKHIKTAREAAGMTLDRLAELVYVTPDVIEGWESGEVRTISGPALASVCAVLNVDANWLLSADDE